MNINNINNNAGIVGSMFSTSTAKDSHFGSLVGSLGDYSLIRSGVYKKMMKEYYSIDSSHAKTLSSKRKDETATMSKEEADKKTMLSDVKKTSDDLMDSSAALGKQLLSQGDAADRDKVNSAVKDFVSSYNDFVDRTGKTDVTASISQKNLSALKATSANSKLLKSVGINYDSKGKLTVDEDTLNKASVSTLQSLFTSKGSFGDTISDIAKATYGVANSAANSGASASYGNNGSYSVLGSTKSIMDQFM